MWTFRSGEARHWDTSTLSAGVELMMHVSELGSFTGRWIFHQSTCKEEHQSTLENP